MSRRPAGRAGNTSDTSDVPFLHLRLGLSGFEDSDCSAHGQYVDAVNLFAKRKTD
jgi:hypothetical protein